MNNNFAFDRFFRTTQQLTLKRKSVRKSKLMPIKLSFKTLNNRHYYFISLSCEKVFNYNIKNYRHLFQVISDSFSSDFTSASNVTEGGPTQNFIFLLSTYIRYICPACNHVCMFHFIFLFDNLTFKS